LSIFFFFITTQLCFIFYIIKSTERVFILGDTGNIGTKLVQDLLAKNIPVTLYARTPSKVKSLFGSNNLINVVQGDYSDLSPLKEGIKNHTRLFLLAFGFDQFVEVKTEIATIVYTSGVKQLSISHHLQ
jgi:putative NADH-flavin reductase